MTSQLRPEDHQQQQHHQTSCSTASPGTKLTSDLSTTNKLTPQLWSSETGAHKSDHNTGDNYPQEEEETDSLNAAECAVCMHYNSDTVIYDCGHCCLCYNCAHDLLRLKHHCPICRRPIKDV